MKLTKYIPATLVFFMMIGIVFGYYINPSPILISILLLFLLLLLIFSFYITNKSFKHSYHFIIITYLLFFTIGIASITYKNQLHHKKHYTHFIKKENELLILIKRQLKSNPYYHKYIGNISQLNDNKTVGNILINIQKDSLHNNTINIGDLILVKTSFNKINKPLNPFQFDYQKYLEQQQIHHQIKVKKEELFFISHQKTLAYYVSKIHQQINNSLIKYGFKKEELAIINAIVLGDRNTVSKDLLQNYINAGAIHILAVSGLHIGILLLLLNAIFKPLEVFKKGKIIKVVLIVLLLWLYALLAGLSPSVIRAVTMFTAVSIGEHLNKKTSTIHSLFISMFVLLLINPFYLFKVGFQLSYLAVFSIVYFNPLFLKIYYPLNKIKLFFWQIFAVSFAAQLGTLPLSLYYFHQFPALFFVSSMVIIPFLGIILGLGLLIIILALLNELPLPLAQLFSFIIRLMNDFITFIAKQETYIFKQITFSVFLVIALYFILNRIYHFWDNPTSKKLAYLLMSILIFQSILFFEKYKRETSKEFLILNQSKNSILIQRNGKQAIIHSTLDSLQLRNNSAISNYLVGTGKITFHQKPISNVFQILNNKLLVVDSLGIYQISKLKPKTVLLTQSPRINLNRLITMYNPTIIIADASNYKSYKKQWQKSCKLHQVEFYDTSKNGFFKIVKYK